MIFPDKDLVNLLYDNWTFATEGFQKAQIVFSQAGFRTDESLFEQTNIWVEMNPAGLRRLADVEEFFSCTINVTVVYWSKAKTKEDVQTDKDKVWTIIEEIKKLAHDSTKWPSSWNYCKVDAVKPTTPMVPKPPELYEYEIAVNIRLFWSPT